MENNKTNIIVENLKYVENMYKVSPQINEKSVELTYMHFGALKIVSINTFERLILYINILMPAKT